MSTGDYNPGSIGQDSFARSANTYPFVPETPVNEIIEDIVISSFETPQIALWMTWVSGLGTAAGDSSAPPPAHEVDLLIQDENSDLLLDTRSFPTFHKDPGTNGRETLRWISETTSITMIVNRSDPSSIKSRYRLSRALLDPRTTHWRARPLLDLKVWTGSEYVSATRSDGTIRIREGLNAKITTETEVSNRGEGVHDLNLDFIGGEGQGRFPACDHGIGVRKLGEAMPDAQGDLVVHGDSCIDVQPAVDFSGETATIRTGEFTVRDGCSAPCECSDFSQLYKYTRQVWSKYQDIARRANELRDEYHSIRDFMDDVRKCAERQTLRVLMWPVRDCTFAAAVGLCNPSDQPIHDVTVQFNFTTQHEKPILPVCDTIYRVDHYEGQQMPTPYMFEEGFPDPQIKLRCIPPGSMGYVVFKAEFPDAVEGDKACFRAFCPVGVPLPLVPPDPVETCVDTVCPENEDCFDPTATTTAAS